MMRWQSSNDIFGNSLCICDRQLKTDTEQQSVPQHIQQSRIRKQRNAVTHTGADDCTHQIQRYHWQFTFIVTDLYKTKNI